MQPICWSDSWPDLAIAQAKVHNAKLFKACPAIKANAPDRCVAIKAQMTKWIEDGASGDGPR